MITLTEVFIIIFIHWIADFILQTHEQASNKSKSNYWLTKHIVNYTIIWIIVCMSYCLFISMNIKLMILFPIITFICHWITDYFTSRWTSKLYNKGDYHNFFVIIGLDQILHYLQLFVLYYILK